MLYPASAGEHWLTWEEFLGRCGQPAPPDYAQAREAFAQALKATPSERGDWLATIEQLREAPLSTLEDAEFCFSHLPESSKNLFLKQLIELYFHSPLWEGDRVARTARAIDGLGNAELHLEIPELVFIKARIPSPVFRELFHSVASLPDGPACQYLETWDWNPDADRSRAFRPVVVRHLNSGLVLDRLSAKAAQLSKRSALPIPLFFEGSASSQAYLQARLASYGLVVQNGLPRKDTVLSFRSTFFQKLRAAHLPLAERLALSQQWLETTTLETESGELGAWMEKQGISPDRQALLRDLPETVFSEHGTSVYLLPFHPVPAPQTGLYFWEPVAEPPGSLAFDSEERHRLRTAGFAVPEAAPHQERNQERLQALFQSPAGHPFVFLANPNETVPETRCFDLKSASPRSETRERREETIPETPMLPLSATALETYGNCPAQFFYSSISRLRAKKDPDSAFALWFGKLAHRALEKAFRETPWREVDEACLMKAFDASLEENAASLGDSAWLRVSLRRRFAPVAEKVPAIERGLREAFGALEPKRFEEDFEIELAGRKIRGRIDRLDQTADGANLILDYKTGNVDFSPEQTRKGTNYQALVYALACEARFEKPAGVLFYDLKKGETRRGLIREAAVPSTAKKTLTRGHALAEEKWKEVLKQGEEHAIGLITALGAGDFRATPSAQACEYCDFGNLCRQRFSWTGGGL